MITTGKNIYTIKQKLEGNRGHKTDAFGWRNMGNNFIFFTVINAVYTIWIGTAYHLPTCHQILTKGFPVTWGCGEEGSSLPLVYHCNVCYALKHCDLWPVTDREGSVGSPGAVQEGESCWCQCLLSLAECGKIRDIHLRPTLGTVTTTIQKRPSWDNLTQWHQVWHNLLNPRQH